jgi:N1-aminopropylagmatine ureohydrolase
MTNVPDNFLGLEPALSNPVAARYAVLPLPYEGTVLTQKGASNGPAAIIAASQQVERYDEELRGEFHTAGVVTCEAVPPADTPEEEMRRITEAARPVAESGKFVLGLGGEHSVTVPLVQVASEVHGPISVLQIDAHADLRNVYNNTPLSHACVMRRVLEVTDHISQVGMRAWSYEEQTECTRYIDAMLMPDDIAARPDWIDDALSRLTDKVYITVDIDGFDPSICPGTGTPEPGGLSWQQVTGLLRRVCNEREVVAADIVEVRPIAANHVTEFVAARLAYKLIAYTQ